MRVNLQELEKAAMDTYAVAGLLGCLIMAVRDKGQDSATEPAGEVLCWQLKESLQIAYDILDRTSTTFISSVEILEQSSVVKGQGEAETP